MATELDEYEAAAQSLVQRAQQLVRDHSPQSTRPPRAQTPSLPREKSVDPLAPLLGCPQWANSPPPPPAGAAPSPAHERPLALEDLDGLRRRASGGDDFPAFPTQVFAALNSYGQGVHDTMHDTAPPSAVASPPPGNSKQAPSTSPPMRSDAPQIPPPGDAANPYSHFRTQFAADGDAAQDAAPVQSLYAAAAAVAAAAQPDGSVGSSADRTAATQNDLLKAYNPSYDGASFDGEPESLLAPTPEKKERSASTPGRTPNKAAQSQHAQVASPQAMPSSTEKRREALVARLREQQAVLERLEEEHQAYHSGPTTNAGAPSSSPRATYSNLVASSPNTRRPRREGYDGTASVSSRHSSPSKPATPRRSPRASPASKGRGGGTPPSRAAASPDGAPSLDELMEQRRRKQQQRTTAERAEYLRKIDAVQAAVAARELHAKAEQRRTPPKPLPKPAVCAPSTDTHRNTDTNASTKANPPAPARVSKKSASPHRSHPSTAPAGGKWDVTNAAHLQYAHVASREGTPCDAAQASPSPASQREGGVPARSPSTTSTPPRPPVEDGALRQVPVNTHRTPPGRPPKDAAKDDGEWDRDGGRKVGKEKKAHRTPQKAAVRQRTTRGPGSYLQLRQTLVSSAPPAAAASPPRDPLLAHRNSEPCGAVHSEGAASPTSPPLDSVQPSDAERVAEAQQRQQEYRHAASALSRQMIDTADKLHSQRALVKKLQRQLDGLEGRTQDIDASFEVASQLDALRLQRDELQKQLRHSLFLAGKRRQAETVRRLQRVHQRRDEVEKELTRGHETLRTAEEVVASLRAKKAELAAHLEELEQEAPQGRRDEAAEERRRLEGNIAEAQEVYPADTQVMEILDRNDAAQRERDSEIAHLRALRDQTARRAAEAADATTCSELDAEEVAAELRCRRAAEAHWSAVLSANPSLSAADALQLCASLREHAVSSPVPPSERERVQRQTECIGAAEVVERWVAASHFADGDDVHSALATFVAALQVDSDEMARESKELQDAKRLAPRPSSEAHDATALAHELAAVEERCEVLLWEDDAARRAAMAEQREAMSEANRVASGAEARCARLRKWQARLAALQGAMQEDEGEESMVEGRVAEELVEETRKAVQDAGEMVTATVDKADGERARLRVLEGELDKLAEVEVSLHAEVEQQGAEGAAGRWMAEGNPTLKLQWQLLDNLQEEVERAEAATERSMDAKVAAAEEKERALVQQLTRAKADAAMLQSQEKDLEREMARLTAEYHSAQARDPPPVLAAPVAVRAAPTTAGRPAAPRTRDRVREAIVESLGQQQRVKRATPKKATPRKAGTPGTPKHRGAPTPRSRTPQTRQKTTPRRVASSARSEKPKRVPEGAPVDLYVAQPQPAEEEAVVQHVCPSCAGALALDNHGRPMHPYCGMCGACVSTSHPLLHGGVRSDAPLPSSIATDSEAASHPRDSPHMTALFAPLAQAQPSPRAAAPRGGQVQLWGPASPYIPRGEALEELARVRAVVEQGQWVMKKGRGGHGRRLLRLANDLSRLEIRRPGKKVTEDFLRLDRIISAALAKPPHDPKAPAGTAWLVLTQSARMEFVSETAGEAEALVHVLSMLVKYRAHLFFLKYNLKHLR